MCRAESAEQRPRVLGQLHLDRIVWTVRKEGVDEFAVSHLTDLHLVAVIRSAELNEDIPGTAKAESAQRAAVEGLDPSEAVDLLILERVGIAVSFKVAVPRNVNHLRAKEQTVAGVCFCRPCLRNLGPPFRRQRHFAGSRWICTAKGWRSRSAQKDRQ